MWPKTRQGKLVHQGFQPGENKTKHIQYIPHPLDAEIIFCWEFGPALEPSSLWKSNCFKKSPLWILLDLGLDIMMGDDLGFLPGI